MCVNLEQGLEQIAFEIGSTMRVCGRRRGRLAKPPPPRSCPPAWGLVTGPRSTENVVLRGPASHERVRQA